MQDTREDRSDDQLQGKASSRSPSSLQRLSKTAYWCFPILEWLPQLGKPGGTGPTDFLSGLVIGVMLVPTSLSWAALAQIPLQCGLAAALFSSFAYGLCGQCSVISLGPVAEVTTILISIQSIAVADRQAAFQSIGVQVGILSVLLSVFGGGNVIRTIFAKPVADGYIIAAALLVIITQARVMLNVPAPSSTSIQDALYTTVVSVNANFGVNNAIAFLLFSLYCGYLLGVKKINCPSWVPHPLIVVVASILITWYFKLDETIGLKIVKDLPPGIPPMAVPSFDNFLSMAPYTSTVTIIAFLQNYCIARKIAPSIDPDRELFASGISNLASCLLGGMPVASSLARSGVLMDRNVKTPLPALIAGCIILFTMTVLTHLGAFYYLPIHALTAIIVSGVIKLCDFTEAQHLYRVSFMDFSVWATTFVLTLVAGITVGVLTGIALSLVLVILRVSRPRVAAVGYEPDKSVFNDLRDDPELLVYPNILVWRFDGPLYFVSIGYFEETLKQAVLAEMRNIDVVIVYCSKISDIDSAAVSNLPIIVRGIETMDPHHPRKVLLAQVDGRIAPALQRCPLNKPLKKKNRATTRPGGDGLAASPSFNRDGSLIDLTRLSSSLDRAVLSRNFLDSEQVFFRSVAEAILFAQRYVEELNVHRREKLVASPATQPNTCEASDPKPHVSFLMQAVMEAEGDFDSTASTSFFTPKHLRGGGNKSATYVRKLREASLFHPGKELVGVIGIVRHAERTPKQKIKLSLAVGNPGLAAAFRRISVARGGLVEHASQDDVAALLRDERLALPPPQHAEGAAVQRAVHVIGDGSEGLEIKLKVSAPSSSPQPLASTVELVIKWGGTLSAEGALQARQLGRGLIARFFAAGDMPLDAMRHFTTHADAFAPQEERLLQTAAVMMRALTGRQDFSDIAVDDRMLGELSTTAKVLQRRAERQFSALMHVRSVAGASHCLHIPGIRELLRLSVPAAPTATAPPRPAGGSPVPGVTGKAGGGFQHGGVSDLLLDHPMAEEPLRSREAELPLPSSSSHAAPTTAAALSVGKPATSRAVTASPSPAATTGSHSPPHQQPQWKSPATAAGHTTPYTVLHFIGELLRIVAAQGTDLGWASSVSILLHQRETLEEFVQRWRKHCDTYWRAAGSSTSTTSSMVDEDGGADGGAPSSAATCDEFDLSNIRRLVDDARYDSTHNADLLHKAANSYFPVLRPMLQSLAELDKLLKAVEAVATSTLRGLNRSERFILASHICQPLFAQIERDVALLARNDAHRAIYAMLEHAQRLYIAAKAHSNVEAVLAVQDKMITSVRRRMVGKAQRGGATTSSSTDATAISFEVDPATERFLAHKQAMRLVDLYPEASLGERSLHSSSAVSGGGGGSDEVCTRFYFAPQSHASTAQACLFDCNSIKGFTRREETMLEGFNYTSHIIFKVFRCQRPSLSDAEYHDLLLALPLAVDASLTEGEQDRALREGLLEVYHQRFVVSVETFMSSGSDAPARGTDVCGVRPMLRVHQGMCLSQLTALNHEIATTMQLVPN